MPFPFPESIPRQNPLDPNDDNMIGDPYVWHASDYVGNMIMIVVNWDTSDGDLMSAIVYRDAACLYDKIFLGLGPDGTPNTSSMQWTVPAGETLVRANLLKKVGMTTINHFRVLNITAGT